MAEVLELWEQPESEEMYMIVGWRQWADAGSVSSGLPRYLIQETKARQIGVIHPDNFYLFQIPGTHDLVRPVVRFEDGFPESMEERQNEFYFTGDEKRGVVIFLGDEPHLGIDRYMEVLLDTAESLGVRRIIGLGGVFGELPYDKERPVSCNYSLRELRAETEGLAVMLSDYHGGASIGSYLCQRAGEREMEYVGFYALVPTYDFSNVPQIGNAIRIENDYTAWLGIMRRINHMLNTGFDLADLEDKSQRLVQVVDAKVEELDDMAPQLEVREYLERISQEFTEVPFEPLDEMWEEELRRLFDDEGEDT